MSCRCTEVVFVRKDRYMPPPCARLGGHHHSPVIDPGLALAPPAQVCFRLAASPRGHPRVAPDALAGAYPHANRFEMRSDDDRDP
jgi:hypothetical protein